MKRLPAGWMTLAFLLSLSAYPLLSYPKTPTNLFIASCIILVLAWGFVLLLILKPEQMRLAGIRLNELRRSPTVAMLLSTVLLLLILVLWSHFLLPEFSLFSLSLYIFLMSILWAWENSPESRTRIDKAFAENRFANFFISLLTILLLFAFLELYMRFTQIMPDGLGMTPQFSVWMERYYQPINSLGRRAYEPMGAAREQESILVVGDSFAAGHGINDINDVFAYQLWGILGENYVVNLNAELGISPTLQEWVLDYPVKPDILILSHVINDIESSQGLVAREYQNFAPNPVLNWFTSHYFLFGFAYWHNYAAPRIVENYADEIFMSYEDEAVWARHAAKLQEFIEWSANNETRLILILWPTLNNFDLSAEGNRRVKDLFESQGIPVVDMEELLEPLSVQERVINNFDGHPSVLANQIAAEALAQLIQAMD